MRRSVIHAVLTATAAGCVAVLTAHPGDPQGPPQAPPPSVPAGQSPDAPQRGGGFGGRVTMNETTDFTPKPPYVAREPGGTGEGLHPAAGYRLELVAADPDVISPAVIEFDGNGRMYVSELISYMMDAEALARARTDQPHQPLGKHQGRRRAMTSAPCSSTRSSRPRMILPLTDGVILTSETDSDELVKWSDTNADGVADKREVVFTGIGQSGDSNIEHQKAGLLWNMDNWIYTTYNAFRIRWTPSGFLPRADRRQRRSVGSRRRTMTGSRGSSMPAASAGR